MKCREITESVNELPALILVSPTGKVELERMSFQDYLHQREIPNVGALVTAGNLWCNVGFVAHERPFITVFWSTLRPRQIPALQATLYSLGISEQARCDINANGQRVSTTVGRIQPFAKPRAKPASKQLRAAEQMGVEVLDDDLQGNTFNRIVWERTARLESHDPALVSLATHTGQYPGIYAVHVGDPEFWFHKLIDDYGNADIAWEIDLFPSRGDVLVEDVQYAMPDDSGNKAYSAILLTTRRVLREGKDFRYTRQWRDQRAPSQREQPW